MDLLSIATNTCGTYCLTLIKSKLLAGSYDSCFTHLLLRVWGRLARFIYWLGFRVERDTITAQSFLFT
jgi:hypothetical protein